MKIKPHGSKPISDEDRRPKFSLRLLQTSHCISCCTKDEKAALADKMHTLSALPWSEIRKSDRHGLGFEKIAPASIKAGIPEPAKDKNIIAFRFAGMKPMVGFKEGATFYVLWLDRDFTLYKH
ncbi:hypothetical protein [Solidesulfovibrio sp.]